MFLSPHQTTSESTFDIKRIVSSVRNLEIGGELITAEFYGCKVGFIPRGVETIPPFALLLTKVEHSDLEHDIVIDGRSLLKLDGEPLKVDEYQHMIRLAALTSRWVKDPKDAANAISAMGDYPIRIFAAWVANTIGFRLGADLREQSVMRICFTIHFVQMLEDMESDSNGYVSERDYLRLSAIASRNTMGINTSKIMELLGDNIPKLNNLKETIDWIKLVLSSPRIDQLNYMFVVTSLGMHFMPKNRNQVVSALEYPPYFIAILFSALNERNYKQTRLSKVAQEPRQKDAATAFGIAVERYLKHH